MSMRITVLIPTHFRDEMLREALASLVAQTHEDWQAFVMDNGGDARAVVRDTADPRVTYRWFPEVPSMTHGTRFREIWDSDGYGCALHDDDRLTPDSLAERASYLDANPDCGLVFTAMMPFGKTRGGVIHADPSHFCDDYMQCRSRPISVPTAMWRNEVMRDYPPDSDCKTGITDGLWFYRMFMGGVRFGYIDEPLYDYRVHAGQESGGDWFGPDRALFLAEHDRIDRIVADIKAGKRDPRHAGLWDANNQPANYRSREMSNENNAVYLKNSYIPALQRELAGAKARGKDTGDIEAEIRRASMMAGLPDPLTQVKKAPERRGRKTTA